MPTHKIANDDFWSIPPLSDEDQDLVNAYREIGVPLDQLPYTDSYDRLVEMLGKPKGGGEIDSRLPFGCLGLELGDGHVASSRRCSLSRWKI